MSLDLGFDDAQHAIGSALAQFCRERCDDTALKSLSGRFPRELWNELAQLGVLALATPEGDGGALELVAALEALGRAVFPGPLVATFTATQLLPETARVAVARGEQLVSLGTPPLMPWAPAADLFLELEGDRAYQLAPRGAIAAVETLGGEPWGRGEFARERELGPAGRARVLGAVARAAQLAALGQRLLDDTAEHARTRVQFGRAIGEFQAVAHPLADCAIQLAAAATLARAAAFHFDADGPEAERTRSLAAAARLSAARCAVASAHLCHQLFGAVGIALEGPVFHVSRRIRQLAAEPPGDAPARQTLLRPFDV